MIVHQVGDNLRRISQIAFAFDQEHKIITSYDELRDFSNVVILVDESAALKNYKNPISMYNFKPKKDSTYVIGKNYPDTPLHEQIPDNDYYDFVYIPLPKPIPLHAENALSIFLYYFQSKI